MPSERYRKCVRRSTLAALPIRGLPFPDAQPSTQPGSETVRHASVPTALYHRKVAGQQATSDWLPRLSEQDSNRKLVEVSDDETDSSGERRTSCIPTSGNLKSSTTRHHRGHKLNDTVDAANPPEELLHENGEDGSTCQRKRSKPAGRPVSVTTASTQPRWLGRTPSWPSSLIRVKERILEKVYVTSSEWPDAAAIERERRQRAAMAFMLVLQGGSAMAKMTCESTLSGVGSAAAVTRLSPVPSNPPSRQHQQLQLQPANTDKRRVRIQSEPQSTATSILPGSESERLHDCRRSSKLAFRRRSISEETSDRPTTRCRRGRSITVATSGSSGGTHRGAGIVCSDDDLRAIVYEHRLRQSISPCSTLIGGHELRPSELESGERVTFDLGSPGDDQQTPRRAASTTPAFDCVAGGRGGGSLASGPRDDELDSPSPQLPQPRAAGVVTSQPVCCIAAGQRTSSTATTTTTNLRQSVPEVVFDEFGQTWDVYGAEFDPEILGLAIQVHLQKMMATSTRGRSQEFSGDRSKNERVPLHCQQISDYRLMVSSSRRTNRLVDFVERYLCSVWHRTAVERPPMATNI